MNWVEPFYTNQYQWGGLLDGAVREHHREKAAFIAQLSGSGIKRLLELGAGGGQHAAAAAELGHTVHAVELVRAAAVHAQRLAAQPRSGELIVVHGDFYDVALPESFDVVCYWDGFGIGIDDDQRRLLRRITHWLAPDGCALIECYTPWYAASVVGKQWQVGQAMRRYDFDAEQCRWLDTWWTLDDEAHAVTQSLRCYSPADLRLLLEGTGLSLELVQPGGTMDWVQQRYIVQDPLEQAMVYVAKVVVE